MTISYTNFFAPTVLTTGAVTLYTVPASPASSLLRGGRLRASNTTGSAQTVTLYHVPVSGTAGAGNTFAPGVSVPANNYLDIDIPIMAAGETLQAIAGAAASINVQMLAGGVYS